MYLLTYKGSLLVIMYLKSHGSTLLHFNFVTYSLDTIMNYFFLTQCHKFFAKVVESVYKRTESFIKIPHHAHTNFSKII